MVTVHRAFGYRFVVFVNDHSPPHVHVVGQGGEAKITCQAPRVCISTGSPALAAPIRRIVQEVRREHARFMDEWERIHG